MSKCNQRKKYIIDARGKILGRLASQIAQILYGKNKVDFSFEKDCGDWVYVVNAKEIKVTGSKKDKKIYYRHTGYPGGIKSETLAEVLVKKPEDVIKRAVFGMLPKNKISKRAIARLIVYRDGNFPKDKEMIELN